MRKMKSKVDDEARRRWEGKEVREEGGEGGGDDNDCVRYGWGCDGMGQRVVAWGEGDICVCKIMLDSFVGLVRVIL